MSSFNHQLGPTAWSATTTQANGKRKRTVSPEKVDLANGNSYIPDQQHENFYSLLGDILEILRRQDTNPSVLDCPITSNNEETHSAKRTKLTDSTASVTIASQIKSNAYSSIQEFVTDVDRAVSIVISDIQGSKDGQQVSSHLCQTRTEVARVMAVQKELGSIIIREMVLRPKLFSTKHESSESLQVKVNSEDNGQKTCGSSVGGDSAGGTVLTLYGSAPHPRQLFSSLQKPIALDSNPTPSMQATSSIAEPLQDENQRAVYAPLRDSLRELALPNGISTTKIVPVHSAATYGDKKRIPTLGELFASPLTLIPLNPPRQSRHTATRSSSVNWFNASEVTSSTKTNRRESYTSQPLSTGQWLNYNVAPSPTQLSSPEAKRKQRDRALSFGEPQITLSQEAIAAHQQAKEDALFRSVYSSFAPDRDNTAALVPEHTKNRLWFDRVGESRLEGLLPLPNTGSVDSSMVEVNGISDHEGIDEETSFKDAVDSWMPEGLPSELLEAEDSTAVSPKITKEVEQILQGISELLETLNSYQRIRNLSFTSSTRTIPGQNAQHTTMPGTFTGPSDAEYDVYSMLKSQLTMMVSMLPPFALAKLDGEKLEALNINTRIQLEGKNWKGSMEEDEAAAKARLASTPGYTARAANQSTTLPARNTVYPHSGTPVPHTPRSSFAPQPAVPRPAPGSASYLPNQQYSARPPSSNHYFSGSSRSSYPQQRPVSSASASERYSYSASHNYTPQPAQPSHSQYPNGFRQYPTTNGTSYSQQYSTPPQTAATVPTQGSQQRPTQPGYQQRAMNSQGYGYTPATAEGSATPPKATAAYNSQNHSQNQHLPSYSGQTVTPSQQRPQLYHQHSSQHGVQASTLAQVNGANPAGTSSQPTYLTADEQALLMNRQKAQLAEQQNTPIRQGSGTPQPVNGGHGSQQNNTAVVQQNGVMVGQGQ